MPKRSGEARALLALAAAALLAGCEEHLDRRDTIIRAAGDGLAVNMATEVIEPWPRSAWRRRFDHDGKLWMKKMETYQEGEAKAKDADQKSGKKPAP